MATATLTNLTEQTFSGHPHKVDREAGIIYGVKVLGKVSKNGREYSDQAMRKAAKFYEGIEVNIDHPDRKNPGRERGIRESFGVLKNSEVRDGDVWADLHYVKSHDLAEQITERAERFPDKLGLSHNASGNVVSRGGKQIVEDIDHVRSVDIVTRPATNAGLFESQDTTMRTTYGKLIRTLPESIEKQWLLEMEGDMAPADTEVEMPAEATGDDQVKAAFRAAVVAAFDDDSLDMKATLSRIKEVLAAHDKLANPKKKEDPPAEAPPAAEETAESVKFRELQDKLSLMESRDEARGILEEAGVPVTRLNVNGYLGQETAEDKTAFLESLKVGRTVTGSMRPASSPPKQTQLQESAIPEFNSTEDVVGFLRGR